MKIDVFCAWGDGPDVGINITRENGDLVPVDLTASRAREIAAQLVACAERAEALDKEYADHAREHARTTEAWRESIAAAVGCEVSDIKTVKELLQCNPVGACETHGRCWTHSEWETE